MGMDWPTTTTSQDIVLALVIAVLVVIPFLAIYRLLKSTPKRLPGEEENIWAGAAFDVKTIAPRIERLRENHIAGLQSRPHPRSHPKWLLAASRQALGRFAYFSLARREETEAEDHPSETHAI